VIAPAVSTGTGLLLEPALTLPEFTREKFVAAMNTVGPEKIHRPWTMPSSRCRRIRATARRA
jgi:hypothetical protein